MKNVKEIEVVGVNGEITKHIIIERDNGEFTSMPKAVYDAQVEHLTENLLQP